MNSIFTNRIFAFKRIPIKRCLQKYSKNTSHRNIINVKDIGPGGFALLSIPIATFCLGTWQVKRRSWKLDLIEQIKKKHEEPPVDLPDILEDLSKMEYQKVKVSGYFDHSKELYIGPRHLLVPDKGSGVFSTQSKSGNLVITPFHISDRNITILVNRGWVPKNKTNPSDRKEAQVTDEIELIGTVRLTEKRPQFSPKMQEGSRLFLYRDVPKMAAVTGSEPIFLDAGPESTIPGGPIGGQTRITLRNEHFAYLVTWYALSIATSYMWYKKFIKGRKLVL